MQTYTLPVLASIFITILLILGVTSIIEKREANPLSEQPSSEEKNTVEENILPYGVVALRVGEKATFADISIQPLQIVEESRCPEDVLCIQAGTLRVKTQIVSGLGTSTDDIALGSFISTEAERVELTAATPYPVSSAHIPASAYVLTYTVTKRPLQETNPSF